LAEAIADKLFDCIEDGATQDNQTASERPKCKQMMENIKQKAGSTEPAKSIVGKRLAKFFKEVSLCKSEDGSEVAEDKATKRMALKECRKDTMRKVKTIMSAMPDIIHVRDIKEMKRHGETSAAAEVQAACVSAENESATTVKDVPRCELEARQEFEAVSGTDKGGWTSKVAERVARIADAIINGRITIVKPLPKINVDVVTDETECNDETLKKVTELVSAKGKELNKKKFGFLSETACRVVDGFSEYLVSVRESDANGAKLESPPAVTQDEMDAASESLDKALPPSGTGITRRLVVSTSSAGAAQATEVCPVDDDNCGKIELSTSDKASVAPRASASSVLVCSVCLFVFAFVAS